MVMNLVNSVMDLFVPPASMVVMAFSWPALCFINTFDWLYKSFYGENMEDKVVIVTGASSGIGEAAKAAVINFYETLRYEVGDEIGVTIATHGWVGSSIMSGGKFMLEEGAEMQWREEREGNVSSGPLENYAKMIVSGACRGNHYVRYPSWYDIFLLYRFFAPGVLNWTLRQLLASHGARRTSLIGTGRPLLEGSPSGSPSAPRSVVVTGTVSRSPVQMQKLE
ncbi:11-beta-hydroxysteroid dehydrogenase B [Linum grandiflorum]